MKPENDKLSEQERELADEQLVGGAYQQLLDCYLASRHRKKVDLINKAFHFAKQAHKGVRRLSGEPYIMHPLAVAMIACEEMGLGATSICAALLHDVVEDTDYTVEDIENMFGKKIATIVDGLTKISGGIFGDKASAQAENFKKLLLTMSDDIRVILIKICDRLHNMRTLASQPANKQYKIAGETLYIYAPLANRLGLNKIKTELEDLSFRYDHPEIYERIEKKLEKTKAQRDELFENFTKPIREALDSMGLNYQLKARVKSPYSIWNKMQNKKVSFEEIYDILAVRIVFTPKDIEEEINECFNIYVALTKIYKSHPDRLRDWLNHPKANGYQALHVTLMSHMGLWIEVQIRSEQMDERAEQGFAAHWIYKEGGEIMEDEGELNDWLRTIKEILDDPQPDAMDFLDAIKLNLFASEIFVFTPKGEIKTMPTGSTALDFAFQIHTFLGSHCIGAKVNHKLVPLSHKLQSGDQVEILTSNSQHVQPSWIDFVSSAKAKAKIQAILRKHGREMQKKGEESFDDFCKKNSIETSLSVIERLCEFHSIEKREDFFIRIGQKNIMLSEKDVEYLQSGANKDEDSKSKAGWRKFVPFLSNDKKKVAKKEEKPDLLVIGKDFNRKKPLYVNESNIGRLIFTKCCHPIPGDDALGYINRKNQIELHMRACPVAEKLKTGFGNRIIAIKWDMHRSMLFDATVQFRGIDRLGLLKDVTEVISSEMNINIMHVNINCNEGIFDGQLVLRIHDRSEMANIINSLKKIEGLQEVSTLGEG